MTQPTSRRGLMALAAYVLELKAAGVAQPREDGTLDMQPVLQRAAEDMHRIAQEGRELWAELKARGVQ